MLTQISGRADLHLGEAGLDVRVFEDAGAEPGRPSFVAQMRSVSVTEPRRPAEKGVDAPIDESDRRVDRARTEPMAEAKTEHVAATAPGPWELRFDDGRRVRCRSALTIGRGPRAALKVTGDDVSRVHARLSLVDDEMALIDLRSSNGTWVNDERVEMAILREGDRVRLGKRATFVIARRD